MRRLPIRLRVTLAFSAVMAVVLAAIGVFLHTRLEAQLTDSIDSGLRSRATEVSALARESGGGLSAADADPLIEQDEGFAQILRTDGTVIDSSPQLMGRTVLTSARLRAAASSPTLFQLSQVQGVEGPVRVLAAPVEGGDGDRIVVVGASLGDRNEALTGLARLLAIGGPVALLLASLAGYGMAAAALRPVDAMRRRADEISSDPGDRLPVPEAGDELSRLGETLNAMLSRLEAALVRERRFVADASHELRTPLALHKTELEVALLEARDEAELREAIASAIEEIDRLIALAEQLLVVARSEDGRVTLTPEQVAVGEVLDAIAARFTARAERAGRTVTVADSDERVTVVADRALIEQALTNLVENALGHGAGPVELAATHNRERVALHVRDHGPGMPADFVEHAFERFSRADPARARGGTGLGLAIVETVAEAHGGAAHAANRHPGVDVWIELPTGAFTSISSPPRRHRSDV